MNRMILFSFFSFYFQNNFNCFLGLSNELFNNTVMHHIFQKSFKLNYDVIHRNETRLPPFNGCFPMRVMHDLNKKRETINASTE